MTMRTGGWTVTFVTYSGMTIPLGESLEREEAAEMIRRRLRRAKRLGVPVAKLGRGQWEFQTPDDAAGISDFEGVLTLRPTRKAYRRIFGRRVIVG